MVLFAATSKLEQKLDETWLRFRFNLRFSSDFLVSITAHAAEEQPVAKDGCWQFEIRDKSEIFDWLTVWIWILWPFVFKFKTGIFPADPRSWCTRLDALGDVFADLSNVPPFIRWERCLFKTKIRTKRTTSENVCNWIQYWKRPVSVCLWHPAAKVQPKHNIFEWSLQRVWWWLATLHSGPRLQSPLKGCKGSSVKLLEHFYIESCRVFVESDWWGHCARWSVLVVKSSDSTMVQSMLCETELKEEKNNSTHLILNQVP